ncbi:hypothetical protein ACMFMG_002528 [Clarireedia jacksonii]
MSRNISSRNVRTGGRSSIPRKIEDLSDKEFNALVKALPKSRYDHQVKRIQMRAEAERRRNAEWSKPYGQNAMNLQDLTKELTNIEATPSSSTPPKDSTGGRKEITTASSSKATEPSKTTKPSSKARSTGRTGRSSHRSEEAGGLLAPMSAASASGKRSRS